MPKKRYTYAEAAKYCGVTERTLRAAYSRSEIRGYHVGRRREFDQDQLNAYLEHLKTTRDPRSKK